MANIKSQKKRVLTNEKRRQRNQAIRSAVRTEIRKFREAVASGDKAAAEAHAACCLPRHGQGCHQGRVPPQ